MVGVKMLYWILALCVAVILFKIVRKKHKEEDDGEQTSSLPLAPIQENLTWEEIKRVKSDALKELKKEYLKPASLEIAISNLQRTIGEYISNHGQTISGSEAYYRSLDLPGDIKKKEQVLRKELNKKYKLRHDVSEKCHAIYLAYKHSDLLLHNPNCGWKNFSGLQKLQTNLKAEEYFEALIGIMHYFAEIFRDGPIAEKISLDIEKTFELWNSRNLAQQNYEKSSAAFNPDHGATHNHFTILSILDYLHRRNKYNPTFRQELIKWCLKDIDLYEIFLMEFDRHRFHKYVRGKGIVAREYTFEDVKNHKNYFLPRLSSFDILWELYDQENNEQGLSWLRSIARNIKYEIPDAKDDEVKIKEESDHLEDNYIDQITSNIEVPKSGKKGKYAFLNSKNEECSTEEAYADIVLNHGHSVMRAEVSFWQGMFCLSFWEEIFPKLNDPMDINDIPIDLFQGADFYSARKRAIDQKAQYISQQNLLEFINKQIAKSETRWTRLLHEGNIDLTEYFRSEIVQSFLKRIDSEIFSKIVYRIARNPNENRAGIADFVVWNEDILKMVEVKRAREKIRDAQLHWVEWMRSEQIPIEIVRVKGV